MIVMHRRADVAAGKMGDALAWAKEAAATFEKVTGHVVEVMVPVGARPYQIVWRSQYEDMAALEAAMDSTAQDADYLAKIQSGSDLFIAGRVRDRLWRGL